MMSWRVSHSMPSRIDEHCTPITTAQRKKQQLHLTKRVRAMTKVVARRRARAATLRACDVHRRRRRCSARSFSTLHFIRKFNGFLRIWYSRVRDLCAFARKLRAENFAHRHRKTSCTQGEKFFATTAIRGAARTENRSKTGESPSSDSQAASTFAVKSFLAALRAAVLRQTPSFAFSAALIAFGSAVLPAGDFIT